MTSSACLLYTSQSIGSLYDQVALIHNIVIMHCLLLLDPGAVSSCYEIQICWIVISIISDFITIIPANAENRSFVHICHI